MVKLFNPPVQKYMPGLLHFALALLALSAFLSDTKFIPGVRNNIGMFELSSLLLIAGSFVYFLRNSIPIRSHPLILVMGFWFVVALLSLVNISHVTLAISVVAVIIVLFQFVFTLALFNVLTMFQPSLRYFLRYITIAAAVIGLWVLIAQLRSPGDYNVAGPFRGRSHAAIYMMAAFWMILIFSFWPGIHRWEKWITYPALGLAAYTVAAALRQSVYTAMIVGMVGLTLSFVFIRGRKRFNLTAVMLFVVAVLALLFLFGGQYITALSLFRRESTNLEARLAMAFVTEEDEEYGESFDAGQRQGAFEAFFENPVLGIGWMGFYRSEYSPTGHELHSTPLRLMAELGIFGVGIYLAFLWIVFSRAARVFWLARNSPYQLSAYILLVALLAQAISHYYNRMFTDRPYWILLVILLVLEAQMKGMIEEAETSTASEGRPVQWQPAPFYR